MLGGRQPPLKGDASGSSCNIIKINFYSLLRNNLILAVKGL